MQGIDIAGIVVRNSVSMNHQIRNNNVSLNKGFIAIYLWNIPGSTARVEFNNINNQGTPFTKGTAGIAADAIGATFNTDLEINNNNVKHSDYGVLVYTVPNAKIRNNTITRNITNIVAENYGQNIYGINVAFSAGAIIENNSVSRLATNGFPTINNPNLNLIGIHAENSPDVQIFENTINGWGKGIQAKDLNSNSDMYCNTFSKNYHGFFLVNAETGDQGVNLTGTTNDRVQDNKWNLGNNANVSPNRISGSTILNNPTFWYYRSPAPMYDISNPINNNAGGAISVPLGMFTANYCENGPIGPGPKSLLRQQKFEAIVNETKNFTSMPLYARYMDHLYAMREFDRDSTWLVTGDVSDSLYLSYFNTRYQGNDGKVCSMAVDWELENYTTLATKTAALNTSCFYTQNIKTVNEIFLATWANDVYELDAVQQQTVLDLACSEAHDNGPAVYAARALIGFFAACDNGFIKSTTEMQGDVAEIEQSENGVSIYPNPSAGLFNVAYELMDTETAEMRVMDIAGKVVYMQRLAQQENSTQLDLQHLSNGIYLYQMVTDKGVVATGRLVINR